MTYDPNDKYFLPVEECPETCAECKYYDPKQKYTYCAANGYRTATFSWKTPRGSIISHVPPCCPWWYVGVDGTKEERRMRFWWLVGQSVTSKMDKDRRLEYLQHINEVGGIEKVDRERFNEVAEAFAEVRERMGI